MACPWCGSGDVPPYWRTRLACHSQSNHMAPFLFFASWKPFAPGARCWLCVSTCTALMSWAGEFLRVDELETGFPLGTRKRRQLLRAGKSLEVIQEEIAKCQLLDKGLPR